MQTTQSVERATVRLRMTNKEMMDLLERAAQITHEVSIAHAATAATLASHREHCDKDKTEMKTDIKSINGKIIAVLVFAVLNLLTLSGYLIANGGQLVKNAEAQTK